MGILSRYILREIALATLIGTLLFTFVLFLQSIGEVMELLVGPNASTTEVLHLFVLTVPRTLKFTIPMGVLVGVLVGLGRLSTDGEITAMRAAGIPGRRVILPITLWATLGAVACAATTLVFNPWAQRESRRISETLRISQVTAQIRPRVFIESFPKFVLYVREVVPGPIVRWKGVFMADMRDPKKRGSFSGLNATVDGPAVTLAQEAIAVPRPDQDRVQLNLLAPRRYEQSYDPSKYQLHQYGDLNQVLEIESSSPSQSSALDHMTTEELMAKQGGEEGGIEAAIELQQRFAFPFACLVFPMVGIPLAISSQRPGRSVGVVLTVVLVFLYWMIWLGSIALAHAGMLPVVPAVWSGNILFALGGLVLLFRLDTPGRRDVSALLLSPFRALASLRKPKRKGQVPPAPSNGARRPRLARWRSNGNESPPGVLIVDRYVLTSFLYYFVALLAAFILIWFVFSFFELLGDMLARDKMGRFIPYIYYLTPFLIYETAPLAILVATLICFFILAKHRELMAFRACGISLYRLAAPIMLVSLFVSGGLFWLDQNYLPETNIRQDAIRDEIKGSPVQTYLRPYRQWTFGEGDRIFYHSFFDSEQNLLAGVNVYDLDPADFRLRRHIAAKQARWDEEQQAWIFENGWVRLIEGDRITAFEPFDARPFPDIEETPSHFFKEAKKYEQMNWQELSAYIRDLTQAGFDTVKFQVQLHKKLAFPLFAFVMAVLAAPFSMLAGHRGGFTGVVMCLGLAVAYYSLSAFFEKLGGQSQLTPMIAAWSPSIIFGLSGAYLFTRVRS